MSKSEAQNEQNEPTMEEILASIRRIISEEEAEEGKASEAAAEEAEAPAAAEPSSSAAPQAAAAAAPQPSSSAPAGKGADNILDLTRMVAEDGSIIDLEAE
jgi:cell pole-organizing protein PopZ